MNQCPYKLFVESTPEREMGVMKICSKADDGQTNMLGKIYLRALRRCLK